MKVLVTGHLGYIGVEAVSLFAAAGHDVTGLDVGWFRRIWNRLPSIDKPAGTGTLTVFSDHARWRDCGDGKYRSARYSSWFGGLMQPI